MNDHLKTSRLACCLRRSALPLLALSALLVGSAGAWPASDSLTGAGDQTTVDAGPAAAYARLPLSFEPNVGQAGTGVDFVARGAGYGIMLAPSEAMLVLQRDLVDELLPLKLKCVEDDKCMDKLSESSSTRTSLALIRMQLVGAEPAGHGHAEYVLPGKSNYFIGNDPSRWRTNVPHYARVRYRDVYPGVDVLYYGNQRELEYDLIVQPGTDPDIVGLQFDGTDDLRVNERGDLVLEVDDRVIIQRRPVVYQVLDGRRQAVAASYELKGQRVGFDLGSFDTSRPLIIDPVLSYSTFLGGPGLDFVTAIAVDAGGHAYVTGVTTSATFPTAPAGPNLPFDPTLNGPVDAFVTKLAPDGGSLVYSTYLGGAGAGLAGVDLGAGIAVDASGGAYVVGQTFSASYPTTAGAFQQLPAILPDAFVTKLDPTGSSLVYSSYWGAGLPDAGLDVAVDATGSAHFTGFSVAPVVGADAFVNRVSPSGGSLLYSTSLGGAAPDVGFGIALHASGDAFVTGATASPNFPVTVGVVQASLRPPTDAFVSRLNPGGGLVYSTYLGGFAPGADFSFHVAIDAAASAYITGRTASASYPMAGAAQPFQPPVDAIVTKLNPSGSGLVYSTHLGGGAPPTGIDAGLGIAVDGALHAHVTGGSASANFPTTLPAIDSTFNGGADVFVTELSPNGLPFVHSTFLGGAGTEFGLGIALDGARSEYVAGAILTASAGFPISPGAFQAVPPGAPDGFVAKIGQTGPVPPTAVPPTPVPPTPTPLPCTGSVQGRVQLQARPSHGGTTVSADGGPAAVTAADGSFQIASLTCATYDIVARRPKYLAARRTGVIVTSGAALTLPGVTLLGGDTNDDARIDLFDLVLVAVNYATCPPGDARADINDDGCVNLADLVTVAVNYGQTGPTAWP